MPETSNEESEADIATPIDEEEEDLLFDSKPLHEKLDAGLDKFSKKVRRQIEYAIKEA